MPDTGASQSIMSADVARDANLSITTTSTELRNASNCVMQLVGEARVVLCNEKHSAVTTVLVSSELNHNALIGWQDIKKLRVIPATFPAVIQSIPSSAAYFAKLDATHGYFQLPLNKEASRLTTFLLPSGRYRYLRAPMGLSSSSDEWCRHSDRVVEGFPWCRKIAVSYTHLRAHETGRNLVCRLLLEKKKK